jgi:hypothetical protein
MSDLNHLHANDLEDRPVNPSSNPHMSELLARVESRRRFLKSGMGAAALGFMGLPALKPVEAQAGVNVALNFAPVAMPVPAALQDLVVVPPGHNVQVLFAWGDPIGKLGQPAGQPAWAGDASETAAQQELQSGAHHDGMHFFPFPARGAGGTGGFSNTRGLLAINHEYVDQGLLFNDGMANWDLAKVRKSQAAHGISVIEVMKQANGSWGVVRPSSYARRVTGNTPVKFSGPAAAVLGADGFGTLNNCAHGYTPWGTYLTCEENFNGYFGAKRLNATTGLPENDTGFVPNALESRYGVNAGGFGYNWHHHDPRFDLNTANGRMEANRFGWTVEIDPFSPNSMPVKRTAMGRFKHEGAEYAIAADGRVVFYQGDDQANEYLYKFVSRDRYNPTNRAANLNLLDHGTLYAARFDAGAVAGDKMGTGVWLPLSLDNPAIAAEFATLGEMLVNTRRAADIAGATRMDRPEWVAASPVTPGEIYLACTNNSTRNAGNIDEANPRPNNRYGHIIRWNEAGGDPAATTFDWDIFVLAGDPTLAANTAANQQIGSANVNASNIFGSPDGLWFDKAGRLWIQTDISSGTLGTGSGAGGYVNITNNMMLAANTVTGEIKRFLTGPKGCEVTGVVTTPDRKTMFVNIQHPGEGAADNSNPLNPAYPNQVSGWPGTQGYGFGPAEPVQAKRRPRSGTVVITRADGGAIGD